MTDVVSLRNAKGQLPLEGKSILITGGTGSLAKILTKRIMSGEMGQPRKIILFSRDEGKQHNRRLELMNLINSTEDVAYHNFDRLVEFQIGDVRDKQSLSRALSRSDIVVNTAAMKQVPACEYFPFEAVKTNVVGAQNLVELVAEQHRHIETVVVVSTDKACMPVNVMGMSKALQERVLLSGNMAAPDTRFFGVRYGNVLASRGSVIPLFKHQIANGMDLTITHPDMTRFLISLNDAVSIIFQGLIEAQRGEIYIPIIPTARMVDLAAVLIGNRKIGTRITGIRPGEKLHEILISEEEMQRVMKRGQYYVLPSIYPELNSHYKADDFISLDTPYSSQFETVSCDEIRALLIKNNLLEGTEGIGVEELIA
jgi:FlaA1/EpsC-like NDP-sugar epimerase